MNLKNKIINAGILTTLVLPTVFTLNEFRSVENYSPKTQEAIKRGYVLEDENTKDFIDLHRRANKFWNGWKIISFII